MSPLLLLLVAVAIIGAAGAGLFLARRRWSAQPASSAIRAIAWARPADRRPRLLLTSTGATPTPGHHGPRPPDAGREWTAEIRWHQAESRFCVVARDGDGVSRVIARSEPLAWPPPTAEAVQELVKAADALSEALVGAGWTPLPPGPAWYERRFQWTPAPKTDWAPPRAPETTPQRDVQRARFRPQTEAPGWAARLRQCEIRWSAGYVRSRFEVVLHDPVQGGRDRVIAKSEPFKWTLMSDPDPRDAAVRQAARGLADALEAAGWERIGAGAGWYAARFVWCHAEPPSDRVEPAPRQPAHTAGGSS